MARSNNSNTARPPQSSSSSRDSTSGGGVVSRSSHGNSMSQTTISPLLGGVIVSSSARLCMVRLFIALALLTIVLDFYFLVLSNQKVVSSRPLLIHQHQHLQLHHADAEAAAANSDADTTTTALFQQQLDPVVALFNASGISLDEATLKRLPTWKQVTDLYGSRPVLAGFQPQSSSISESSSAHSSFSASCAEYRARVPAARRMLGAAGMFSTGTNLITTLLKNNCQIPERVTLYGINASKEAHGMRWQVPWGKHTPAHYKNAHAATHATDILKDDVLPVVTIRNPYWWMRSMCKNPYTTKWHVRRRDKCPDLRLEEAQQQQHQSNANNQQNDTKNMRTDNDDLPWNNVTVKYGAGSEQYQSLVHLFNDWYHGYTQHADYPWVMIRMEDLIFYPQQTVTAVCECAGGRIRSDRPFTFTIESAKADSPGHDTSTGLVEAWIKYGQPLPPAAGFRESDYESSLEALDQNLMDLFHYQHPPPLPIAPREKD